MKRRIIQIAAFAGDEAWDPRLFALAEDGTLWAMEPPMTQTAKWGLVAPLPEARPEPAVVIPSLADLEAEQR